jgi:hypothetical protein
MAIEFPGYILRASMIFAALYLVYAAGFSRLTFHRLNRAFLMSILPLSLLMPILNLGITAPVHITGNGIQHVFSGIGGFGDTTDMNVASGFEWNIKNISLLIYCSIVLFILIRFIINLFRLIRLKRQFTVSIDGKYSIVVADVPSAFSCFNWIFIPKDYDKVISNTVIEHEKLHGMARHTLDLVATELYVAFFWFNPFVYLFRSSLKSIHEFQVDNRFLMTGYKTSYYLQFMLTNLEFSSKAAFFCNSFNGSTIKKRINMMTKSKSPVWKAGMYLFILPLVTLMTMSFSAGRVSKGDIPCICPIKTGYDYKISSAYGKRIHPITKEQDFHNGIDLTAETGTPVVATADGVVTRAEYLEHTFGKLVEIDHGNGITTFYAHLDRYVVKKGDSVKKGDVIGYVGDSGVSVGPHLHYEVLKDGKNVDPAGYMTGLLK